MNTNKLHISNSSIVSTHKHHFTTWCQGINTLTKALSHAKTNVAHLLPPQRDKASLLCLTWKIVSSCLFFLVLAQLLYSPTPRLSLNLPWNGSRSKFERDSDNDGDVDAGDRGVGDLFVCLSKDTTRHHIASPTTTGHVHYPKGHHLKNLPTTIITNKVSQPFTLKTRSHHVCMAHLASCNALTHLYFTHVVKWSPWVPNLGKLVTWTRSGKTLIAYENKN